MISDISIVITAGHRGGYLHELLLGLRRNAPECEVIVVNDDGSVPNEGVIWQKVPNDTYLTRKRNLGVQLASRKYVTVFSDDFEASLDLRRTLIKMSDIMDTYSKPDVLCGTFNEIPYQGHLTVKQGEYIKATRLDIVEEAPFVKSDTIKLWKIDIAVNFFLARRSVVVDIPWDETIGPIGGEHADWFLDLKAKNKWVMWAPGLFVKEQPKEASMESPKYPDMRRRCWDGHKLMLKKRGVKAYLDFDELVP